MTRTATVTLHGYGCSVYAWIARLVLHEKGVACAWREVDPFEDPVPADYLRLNPFGRVPTLEHDGFVLYETAAIARYVDEAFPGPSLQPAGVRDRARMAQVVSVVDGYAYWPLVRQVFSQGFWVREFEPGANPDPVELERGLAAAPTVLRALDDLLGDAPFMAGPAPSLADLHLLPMLAYFALVERGAALLAGHPALRAWLARMRARASYSATRPPIAGL